MRTMKENVQSAGEVRWGGSDDGGLKGKRDG